MNIGCGGNTRPGFINVDYEWHPEIHLCWDIRRQLPLPDASAEGIFTEHCLEHVTYDECLEVLRDLRRILSGRLASRHRPRRRPLSRTSTTGVVKESGTIPLHRAIGNR